MADPILIPIPDLAAAPGNWDLTWQIAIANPGNKRAYKLPSSEYADRLVEQGAFADIRNTKYYVAGRGNPNDPEPGDSTITDDTLQGYTLSGVKLRGIGDLIPGDEYLFDNVDTITFNSMDAENPGLYQFNDGDIIIVTFEPKISSIVAAPGSVGKIYAGVKTHTSTGNILPDDFQKLQQILATSQPISLTLPSGADYPPGVRLTITTNMVNTYQSTILTDGDDVIFITAAGKSKLILGVDEQVSLIWNDDGAGTKGWYVDEISDSYKLVGKFIFSYLPLPNTILFDGSSISKAQFPRAVELVAKLQELFSSAVVSDALWISDPFMYRTKWSLGPDADHLRCPDWRGLFPRALPGDRENIDVDRGNNKNVPGSYEGDAMPKHNHVNPSNNGAFNKLGARAADVDGTGTPGSIDNTSPNTEYRVGFMSGTGYTLWEAATIQTEGTSDYESRGVNGGLFAYGYI